MKGTTVVIASLLIVSAFIAPSSDSTPSRHPLSDRNSCPARAAKSPQVWKASLTVKNDTTETLTLRASDALTRIEPGKTAAFLLRAGESIVLQNAAAGLTAGTVLTTACRTLNNATLHIAAPAAPSGLTGKSLL